MRSRLLMCIVPLSFAACSKSPATKLGEQAQAAGSWTAAAGFAGEQWLAGLIPDQYARSVLETAATQLAQSRTAVDQLPGADPRARRTIDSLVAPSIARADSMRAAIVAGRRAGVTTGIPLLEATSKRLRAMKDSIDRAGP